MKTRFLFLLTTCSLLPVCWFSSCRQVKELAEFDVIYTIPPTSFTYTSTNVKSGEELLYSGAIYANLDSILNANGFSSGVIGNTQFIECSVSIVEPSTETFGWLHSARAEISDNSGFSPAQEVGSVVNNDTLAQTVNLTLRSTNIRPYLGPKFFYLRIFGELNGPLPIEWIEMMLSGQLKMHLEPLN